MPITITEALAELKTIEKRIDSKHREIGKYAARVDVVLDPLEKSGGSQEFIKREQQAIQDLDERRIALRRSIMKSNLATQLTSEGITRTVYDWLIWRKEIAKQAKARLDHLASGIQSIRTQAQAQKDIQGKPLNVIVHLDEQKLGQDRERIETILGTLDGQLSLLNATTMIEV